MSLNALDHDILETNEYYETMRINRGPADDCTLRKDEYGDWRDERGTGYDVNGDGTVRERLW